MRQQVLVRGAAVVAAILATQSFLFSVRTQATAPASTRPLAALPRAIEQWRGVDQPPFDAETLRILAADDYLNRIYVDHDGRAAGLYIAFYASQQAGESIHSPLHCLPGNGWQPISTSRVTLTAGGQPVTINRMLVQKSAQRQVVHYWFAGRGRTVASEYANKLWLVWDGLRYARSEGALVRITTPAGGDAMQAEATAARFLDATFEPLREVLK